jgi:hypothetical protein
MKRLVRVLLGIGGLVAAWLVARGATDPREWPERLPRELTALWDDLDEALAAGRRAAVEREREFDAELGRLVPTERN